ncbi:MAG: enoyl-CoA hydratase/isomerase family protein [Euryarchaeota archaeon]|nr:enoyl-CoA hydratase/isomerase family protein [Euryarchaeota archaeon]
MAAPPAPQGQEGGQVATRPAGHETAPHTDWRVDDDGLARLTLTRPKNLNAIDLQMLDELKGHFETARDDDTVRCVLLTGQGKTFSAGGDLHLMESTMGDSFAVRERLRTGLEVLVTQIWDLEKPVVAAVNGDAYGAGWNLALACDIVIASREARFCQAFAKVGLVPDTGGTWLLPRLVGLHKAKELMMMADTLTAEEAHRMGLVNHVVDHDDLSAHAAEYAKTLARGPTKAYGMLKRAMHRGMTTGLKEALEFEAYSQGYCTTTDDHKEGVAAFFEKRAPRFQGK